MPGSPPADGPRRQRIVQLHPTARCNLACAHCYSSSGPRAGRGPGLDALLGALDDARALGYEVLAVAGGEPLVDPDLPALLAHAQGLGLRTTVTTNGTLLRTRRFAAAVPHLDAVAVSVDGDPATHDALRGRGAFARLDAGLHAVLAAGLPFGVIHTVQEDGAEALAWTARYAIDRGARLLQLHPLEAVGRGAGLAGRVPGQDALGRAYIAASLIGASGRLRVQLDALHRAALAREPAVAYAEDGPAAALPADAIGTLVVQDDGRVSPIAYGLPARLAVAELGHERLLEAWPRFAAERLPVLRALCRDLHARILADDALRLVPWTGLLVEAAQAQAPALVGAA